MSGYEEEELLALSGIQHYSFCPRQWALIHVEQQWAENVLTFEGKQMHRRADDPFQDERRGDVLITRAMPLVSYKLGVYGIADVVEFHAIPEPSDWIELRDNEENGHLSDEEQVYRETRQAEAEVAEAYLQTHTIKLPRRRGRWKPYPVEYKRGKPKPDDCDIVQLCTQAMALEEMLKVGVEEGAIFYGERERRVPVTFSEELRSRVKKLLQEMHAQFAKGVTPPARFAPRCKGCSLVDLCLPTLKRTGTESYLRDYLAKLE